MESTPGKRLQQWRELKGATLTEMHRTTGVKVTTLSQAESGTTNPSYDTISKVLAAYPDLSPDWLLLGTGQMLRDGRTLAAVAHAKPTGAATATLSIAQPTREEYQELQEENRQLREQLAKKEGTLNAVEEERIWLRTELIKKPEASADAAALYETVDEIAREFQIAPVELPEIQRYVPRPAPRMVVHGLRQGAA